MRSDTLRQVVTLVAFVVTLGVNGAANALPINGQMTAQISDSFHVHVIPAGYVFAIWGLIYVVQATYAVWQVLPRNREDEVARALGWLPALSGVLNIAWLLLFHYEVFVLTVPVIVAFLVTLVVINQRLWAHRASLTGSRYWTVRAPWAVYVGWLTVATIANIAQTLQSVGFTGFGIEPTLLAALVLLTGTAIAARWVVRFRDTAYGLVIAWAYVGVVVKEADAPFVVAAAGLGAAVALGLAVRSWLGNRTGSGQPGLRATAA